MNRNIIQNPVIHELKLENKRVSLDPPLEFSRITFYHEMHKVLESYITIPRLTLNTDG